jgi:ATP-dependent exoDNAse (exonuclease V) alpha subunit
MRVLTRTQGHNVVGASAHQAGERFTDLRTGRVYDFAYNRPHVVYAEIMLPEGAPSRFHERMVLWNEVERIEDGNTRYETAQLARDFDLALPRELPRAANIVLARSFCLAEFVARGMVCDLALHEQISTTDGRMQPHVHALLGMREVTPEGFGRKVRAWGSRALFNAWRERWAAYVNTALAWARVPERVDHRSLKAQGIDREPTRHLGRVAWDMEQRGIATRRGAQGREHCPRPVFLVE